ncbi:hypothetical protein H4R20_004554, partial [Coemansia guatemalensis]
MSRRTEEPGPHANSSESEAAEAASSHPQVLYEDEYLKVTEEAITVKRYYFPTFGWRTIPWRQVEWVKLASQTNVGWLQLKVWGIGFGRIWWNCNMRLFDIGRSRNGGRLVNGLSDILAGNIVIKVKEAWIWPGSFVENPDAAMAAI